MTTGLAKTNSAYPPSMFDNTTMDLLKKREQLGLSDEKVMNELNATRYIRNLDILAVDGKKLGIMPIQTEEMVLTAISCTMEAFPYVLVQTPNLCEIALNDDLGLISHFHVQTDAQIERVINANPEYIKLIREPKLTHLQTCLEIDWSSIKYFKKEWIDSKLVEFAIDEFEGDLERQEKPFTTRYKGKSPLVHFTQSQELCDYAFENCPSTIFDINTEFITEAQIEFIINKYPSSINLMHIKFWTKDNIIRSLKSFIRLNEHPFSSPSRIRDVLNMIHIDEVDETFYIDLMKLLGGNDIHYSTLQKLSFRGNRSKDVKQIDIVNFAYPTLKMVKVAYEYKFYSLYDYVRIRKNCDESDSIANLMIEREKDAYANFYGSEKTFARWFYNKKCRLNLN